MQSTRLLRELIALPSVNPAFLPGNSTLTGEHRVADFLSDAGRRAGLDIEFQEVFRGRSNLIARLTPRGKVRRRILLAPHLDTVGLAHEEQLLPQEKNGRIHGRGACDTKGSVAAMFSALCDLAARTRRPSETEIVFAGLIDEENEQSGSRALVKSKFQADLAIVGEPTQLHLITAHKGDLWLQLETRGKAAHGAKPHLGKNAIHAMARIVDALESSYRLSLSRLRHPLLGTGTVNVGSIRGGTQPNIVPDRCLISIDRRTLPGETERSVRREINQLLRAKKLNARILNSKTAVCPPLETNPSLPLVLQLLKSLAQSKPMGADFFCDAAVLAGGGIPSVVFGPGDIAQAHTVDEWVSVKQLEGATHRLSDFLESLP